MGLGVVGVFHRNYLVLLAFGNDPIPDLPFGFPGVPKGWLGRLAVLENEAITEHDRNLPRPATCRHVFPRCHL